MKNHENKTESVKIRLTKTELDSIRKTAEEHSDTVSNVIRDILFKKQRDLCSSIRIELIKQKTYNLIQHTDMPKASRENLIKELNNYDRRWN